MIDEFKGKYAFLSNFYSAPVMYEGLLYQNNEAAFQSAKVLDIERRKQFCELDPSKAKRKGRSVILRHDWESVKDKVMEDCVEDKFTRNEDLRNKLLDTGNEELVEGNTWNDTYWGVCRGRGKNRLGKILMKVRDEIRIKWLDEHYNPDLEEWFDSLPTSKCKCGREFPNLPMYFNEDGLCLVCSQK